jgi:hypothetical protein
VDGGFFLAIQDKSSSGADWDGVRFVAGRSSDNELAVKEGTEETDALSNTGGGRTREINTSMLKNVLSSFGGVRTFIFANKNEEYDQASDWFAYYSSRRAD